MFQRLINETTLVCKRQGHDLPVIQTYKTRACILRANAVLNCDCNKMQRFLRIRVLGAYAVANDGCKTHLTNGMLLPLFCIYPLLAFLETLNLESNLRTAEFRFQKRKTSSRIVVNAVLVTEPNVTRCNRARLKLLTGMECDACNQMQGVALVVQT